MNTRSSKSSKADIVAAEASAWFVEFRTGEATAGDRARFFEWLRRSPDHIQAYLEIAEGWAELPTADPEHHLDMQALIQRARESKEENIVSFSRPSVALPALSHFGARAWAAAFATVVLSLSIVGWLALRADVYSTGVGEQRTLRLADGSTIELNALSRVRVRMSENVREIDLQEGQALFHVAKDKARPFIVHSDETSVRAVGTQFDVYRKSSGTIITVLEGQVAVADASPTTLAFNGGASAGVPLFLVAGEQVIVPPNGSAKKVEPKPKHTDVAVATAWTQQHLIFDDTPLSDVAEEFNRYNTRHLVISDPMLRSMGISGVYSSTDPDSLLGFLRAQPNMQLSESDREIRVALRKQK